MARIRPSLRLSGQIGQLLLGRLQLNCQRLRFGLRSAGRLAGLHQLVVADRVLAVLRQDHRVVGVELGLGRGCGLRARIGGRRCSGRPAAEFRRRGAGIALDGQAQELGRLLGREVAALAEIRVKEFVDLGATAVGRHGLYPATSRSGRWGSRCRPEGPPFAVRGMRLAWG